MNDKHKKLIEDAANKEWILKVFPGAECETYQEVFAIGATYILDNLQLFGLVELENVISILEENRPKCGKENLSEHGEGSDLTITILVRHFEKLKKEHG